MQGVVLRAWRCPMALVRLKTSALGAVLVTGVLALCAPELAAAADPPRYTSDQVSLEPDQEILNLRFHGGRTRTLRTYSLMGDASLFVSTSRNASATPELVTSGQLLDEELSAVINSITRNRLYALDNEQIKARKHLEPTPGPIRRSSPSASCTRSTAPPSSGLPSDTREDPVRFASVGARRLGSGARTVREDPRPVVLHAHHRPALRPRFVEGLVQRADV